MFTRSQGQLGHGDTENRATPKRIPKFNFDGFSCGLHHMTAWMCT